MSGLEQPPAGPDEGQPGKAGDQPTAPPPPLFPIGATGPAAPPPPVAELPGVVPPGAPRRGGRTKLGVALAVVAAIAGYLFVKFVLPIAIVGVAGDVLGVAFGGPYAQLPGDVRAGFEQRLEAALGSDFADQPDAAQSSQLLQLIRGGMPRLGDELIAGNFRLTAQALAAVDEASCASVARSIFLGSEPPEAAATAMVATLSGADLQQWFEVRVAAIEAEVRGSPEQVLILDADVEPLYETLFVSMRQADLETIGSMSSGATIEDAAICSAVRGLYDAVLALPAEDALLFARYDISP